jgi:parvulin-like peptidyl-prolyl isomerase
MSDLSSNKAMYSRALKQNLIPCICLLISVGCGDAKPTAGSKPADVVAAVVNGETISLDELNKRFLPVKLQYSQSLPPQVEQSLPRLQRELLEKLIDKKLLLQEAKKRGLTVDEAELAEYVSKISSPSPDQKTDQEQKKQTAERRDWLQGLKEELLINKLIRQEVEANIVVAEEEAYAYYQAHPEEFQQPERVRVRQIVVETEWEAEDIRKEIIRGGDFAKLAEAKSLSPDGAKGGDLGYFGRGQMPAEFDEVAFSLKKGEISRVFKSSYGYHIFKLTDKKKASTLSFAEAKEKIIQKLKSQKRDAALDAWLGSLKKRAHIQINPYFIKG